MKYRRSGISTDRSAEDSHRRSKRYEGRAALWRAIRAVVQLQRHAPPLRTVPRKGVLPLSFAQERLWFLDQLSPESKAYNISASFRITGPLMVPALEQALNEIVSRHEVLRTTFPAVDGNAAQIIAPELSLQLPMVGLRELPESERYAEALRLATEEAQQPFDLGRGPMFRAKLLRLGLEDHVLLLNMHHIVSDGRSMGVLNWEMSLLYEAFCQDKPSPLSELPIQYADFAVWQREWIKGLKDQHSYWRKRLAGVPTLDLPTDRLRPTRETFKGERMPIELSRALYEALRSLSYEEGATLFMTLMAVFQTMLNRYTGQDDIVVGIPISNRNRNEIKGLIGLFINSLPIRSDLSGNPSFRELLGRVRETSLAAYAHQDLPFEKLVEELQPQRDLSRSPIFQVMFGLQNFPRSPVELQGLTVDYLPIDRRAATLDLSLLMRETPDGLGGYFEYNSDLYERATISRMRGHFQTLLEGITANPERPISELRVLAEKEHQELIRTWNDTSKRYPSDRCIHELFEEQVERSPDAVAVSFEDKNLTYRALNQQSNKLAHYLRTFGVRPDVPVGICLERSLEMIVALLGVLKAGGAYVPMDLGYPKDRLGFMLKDADVSVLLTQSSLLKRLPGHKARTVCLDSNWDVVAREDQENPNNLTTPDNLAYVIYTSGSTGSPNGVQILHRSVVNFLNSMRKQPGLRGQDKLLAVTTLSFDIAVLEVFLPLIVGAQVVIASAEQTVDGAYISNKLLSSRITVMQATPTTWRSLLEERLQGIDRLKILCGGETLSRELAAQLLKRGGSIWNLYGPTEATVWSSVHEVHPESMSATISHPIDNTELYLLDGHSNPVPIGVIGEVHIGGVGLARGYLNRPDLTADRFIPDPFSKEAGSRVYKTGDLGKRLSDGTIELLGRTDQQVKIRGHRIELQEIEATLEERPDVQQVVASAQDDELGGQRLVAYVVPQQSHVLTKHDLRSFLKKRLPGYMVPSTYIILDTLPLNTNGKVDRSALPPADRTRPDVEEEYVAPRNPTEEMLAEIWAKALGIAQVGINDNFFELGGHSLRAVQIIAQAGETFQVELPLRSLFEAPTVDGLAGIIEALQWVNDSSQARHSPVPDDREEGEL